MTACYGCPYPFDLQLVCEKSKITEGTSDARSILHYSDWLESIDSVR